MKHRITGINSELIIKNYKLYKEGIKVTYLKGGNDFHSVEKKENIDKKMLEQAEIFVNDKNNRISNGFTVFLILSVLFGTVGCILFCFEQLLLAFGFSACFLINLIVTYKIFQTGVEYKEKYKLYLENKKTLEIQYNNVVSNEKILCKEKVNEQRDGNMCIINEIDKMSLKELKEMLAKVKRYQEIEPEVIESSHQKKLGALK